MKAEIARILERALERCAKDGLLPEDRPPVQLRTLSDLPPVKPRALAALVAHQADRFFRKNGRPLATDAVWVVNGAAPVARAAAHAWLRATMRRTTAA